MANCDSILIVEDEKDIRETLQEVLRLEGYKTFTASNGREALDMLPTIPRPCLILLDLMMPVMNGWEFLQEQRMNGDMTIATIPVVVVSAAGDKAKNTQTAGFIKKPVELDALLDTVKKYCH
jgi:CheY-like chemotaxis protein